MGQIETGVYMIRNRVNGRPYIGSTRQHFNRRFAAHRNTLRRGAHANPHLQAAWNKYGPEAFEFLILERVEPGRIRAAEQNWTKLG